jgi:hypothetical protein
MVVIRHLRESLGYFIFFLCYGLVVYKISCNFALPNSERGFGEMEKLGVIVGLFVGLRH